MQNISELFNDRKVNSPSISSGTLTLDLSTGRFFNVSLTANVTTLTISNVPSSVMTSIRLVLTQDSTGGRSFLWPSSVKSARTPITYRLAGFTSIFDLYTTDGGTTWFLNQVGIVRPTDPYAANVTCLMHFENSGSLTSFQDEMGNTFTGTGSPIIDLTKAKFGSGSLSLNGSSYISASASANFGFGTGDYTVEFWINQASQTTERPVFDNRVSSSAPGIAIYSSSGADNNKVTCNSWTGTLAVSSMTIPTSQWVHIAVTRAGTTLKCFVNGTQGFSVTDSRDYGSSNPCLIGNNVGASQYFAGNIDEIRITKGTARYSGNFTPDAVPFTP